ncbi:hypothetical protein LXA43DRAFT_1107788 [Ganoderma leucocontextum]|nr:hypothetical protein LXA43DRAFT_1107788 [Ganoderma leucocontextum]
MKTRSARLAVNRVQQATGHSSNRRRTARIAAQSEMDRHVRWASRDQFFSPPPDNDGDSVMEDDEYVPDKDGMDHDEGTVDEDSDTETAHGDDVDTVMGDDSDASIRDASEVPRTPTRSRPYNFGSVILTPDKNKPRSVGLDNRGDDEAKEVLSRYPSLNPNGSGFNRNTHVAAAPTSAGKGKNRAYVQAPPNPPSARKPAGDENVPGPSNRPSTSPVHRGPQGNLQRQKVHVPVDHLVSLGPMTMWDNPVRWYRGQQGRFVRDGSLPPNYYGAEYLKKVQPPRADVVPEPVAKVIRYDTEPLEDPPVHIPVQAVEDPAPQPQARPKRKTKSHVASVVDVRSLRRSIRIRDQLKK